MDTPLVSICVASYNNAVYIGQTLDSIRNQTYGNVELIVVDDCSKDNSAAIIKKWVAANPDFNCIFLQNEVNSGVCKSMNRAVTHSSGQFISIIGSDDILMPEKIEKQINAFAGLGQDYGVLYTDVYKIKDSGERWFSKFIQSYRQFVDIPQGDIFIELLKGNYIPIMSVLWRRECFDKCGMFDESLAYEDYDMLLRTAREFKFAFVDYLSAEYRIHSNNFSAQSRSARYLETDFHIYLKYVGINEEINAIVKVKLENLMIQMSRVSSPNIKKYYALYREYFTGFNSMKIALTTNINFINILKVTRILDMLRNKNIY